MNNDLSELKNIIEAAILVADDPISITRLLSLFPKKAMPDKNDIQQVIDILTEESQSRGITLNKVGSGYRFQSRQRYAEYLRKLYEQKPPRYSRAVLETLSVIAYKQPVTRGDIEEVRGVSVSTEIMRSLLNRGWVKEVGFKAVPGRPALYATTKEFLAYFNLTSIRQMPALQEKRELEEIARDNQISLPMADLQNDDEQLTELSGGDDLNDNQSGNDADIEAAVSQETEHSSEDLESESQLSEDSESQEREHQDQEPLDNEHQDQEPQDNESEDQEFDVQIKENTNLSS